MLADWPLEHNAFGCLEWAGRIDEHGYGRASDGRLAHRVVWEAERGAMPEGRFLDHLCRNRCCCAPWHLELVDQSENERRKNFRYRVKRATCGAGHDLKLYAVMTPWGGRVCRVCSQDYSPPEHAFTPPRVGQ